MHENNSARLQDLRGEEYRELHAAGQMPSNTRRSANFAQVGNAALETRNLSQ